MLYLEGNRILTEAASEAQGQFGALGTAAEQARARSGAKARGDEILSKRDALFSEIENPLDCGQGPKATQLIQDLQRLLPGFEPLSNRGRRCERNQEVIADYRRRIDELLSRADWYNQGLVTLRSEADASAQRLGALRAELSADYSPLILPRVLGTFETEDARYRALRLQLSRDADIRDVDEGLHLSEVQSLGNAFKLPALFIERIDQPVTWVYLLIAFSFDYLMVHCFMMVANNRGRRRKVEGGLAGAW
jgi:hypothetical protein